MFDQTQEQPDWCVARRDGMLVGMERSSVAFVAALTIGCASNGPRPAPVGPRVPVELTADRKTVALDHHEGTGWSPLCTAPCVAMVVPGEQLRIGGKNVVRSDPFAIRRSVTIHARTGYYDMRAFGITLLSVGLSAVGFGGVFAMFNASQDNPWLGGVIVAGAGFGMAVGGVAAIVSNRTTFDVHERTVARLSFVF